MKKICGIGEILIRYSNIKNQQFENGSLIQFNFGGAEYNTICNLSNWGNQCYFLTKLNENWLTHQSVANLKKFGVQTDFIIKDSDITSRLGAYFLFNLQGSGISQIIYDRKNTSFCNLKSNEIATDNLFLKVDTIYLTGITLAVDIKVQKIVLELIKEAKKAKKTIVFDFNYRAKLWSYEEAKKAYESILPWCDIVSCSINDINKILQLSDSSPQENEEQNLIQAYQTLRQKYPNLQLIFQAKREIISPVEQNYQGFLFNGEKLFKSAKYNLKNYLDRIGTGDAFAAGLIHALIQQKEEQAAIEFATKAGALKHFHQGDNNNLQIDHLELFSQNNDVSR